MEYPLQKTRLVTYWDCGLGHVHKTEQSAQRCFDKRHKSKAPRPDYSGRNRAIFLAILDGESTIALADKYNLTKGRTAQIFQMERRNLAFRLRKNGMPFVEIWQKLGDDHRIYACRPYFRSIKQLYLECEEGVK